MSDRDWKKEQRSVLDRIREAVFKRLESLITLAGN
jgi:hypothetical protein